MMVYCVGDSIEVNDRMQSGYVYFLLAPIGADFAPNFSPRFTPKEMLKMGIFEGKYCNDCSKELPDDWFEDAKLGIKADPLLNYFKVKSRQPLSIWKEKGWLLGPDPRGWFQWYYRYFLGRRLPEIDEKQIKRWRAFARHTAQVKSNCESGNWECRPRQRQALLQWSHDPFV